jgi:hypothetical protein
MGGREREKEDFRGNRSGLILVQMAKDENDPVSTCSGVATIRARGQRSFHDLAADSVSDPRQQVIQAIIHLSDICEEGCSEEGDVA